MHGRCSSPQCLIFDAICRVGLVHDEKCSLQLTEKSAVVDIDGTFHDLIYIKNVTIEILKKMIFSKNVTFYFNFGMFKVCMPKYLKKSKFWKKNHFIRMGIRVSFSDRWWQLTTIDTSWPSTSVDELTSKILLFSSRPAVVSRSISLSTTLQ